MFVSALLYPDMYMSTYVMPITRKNTYVRTLSNGSYFCINAPNEYRKTPVHNVLNPLARSFMTPLDQVNSTTANRVIRNVIKPYLSRLIRNLFKNKAAISITKK